MSKIKSKLYSKLFSNKDNDIKQKNSSYRIFNNVVPPISSNKEFQNAQSKQLFQNSKIYDTKNEKVTSSFVIPLEEKKEPEINESIPELMNTLALVGFKTDFKIPKAISREIKSEKLKQLLFCLISMVSVIISAMFISFYFGKPSLKFIPHPVLTIPLLIISITIFLVNIIEFTSLRKEVDGYIEKTLKGSLLPPNFIINNYRKIHGRIIILNWISTVLYITLGISLGIMFLISGQKLTFIVQSWTVTVPNIKNDAITLAFVVLIIFSIHMFSIVMFKYRKRNISSYYGYEIINPEELNDYKKKINRICMIITIGISTIVLFAIIIPIWIVKKRKKKA